MGQSGPINVDSSDWQIDPSGRVLSDGSQVDRLKVVARDNSDIPDGDVKVSQGAVETSNVSTVGEMVGHDLRICARYEANQKTIQSIDQTLDKLVNDAGKV